MACKFSRMASTPAQNRAALCGDPEKFAKIAPVENRARGAEVWFVMDPNRSIQLRWLHGALHDVTSELARLQFSRFGSHTWQPAINAYRCDKCIRVCVDLAGVERSRIDLTVEPDRLIISGVIDVTETTHAEGRFEKLLSIDIV